MIDINSINPNSTTAILLRHAERENFEQGTFGDEATLTKEGIQSAIKFGMALSSFNVCRIYTSPLKRCVQTAENIVKGMDKDIPILCTEMLGDPGFHIHNPTAAGKNYIKYGVYGVFEKFRNGVQMDGFATKEELNTKAYDFIKENTEEKGITLFITHDTLIAHFALSNGIKDYGESKDWVPFLDGCVINFNVQQCNIPA